MSRGLGTRPEEDEPIADWVTSQLDIITIRPLDAVTVPRDGEAVLGAGVSLLAHPTLTAAARLGTLAATAVTSTSRRCRRCCATTRPPRSRSSSLREAPPRRSACSNSRGGGLAGGHAGAAPGPARRPAVAEDEHVLPVAWDGEFYLPLGHGRPGAGGSTEIVLSSLSRRWSPRGTCAGRSGSCSAGSSVVGRRLGLGYDYPLLDAGLRCRRRHREL